jgi:hypothetical protein
MNNLKIRNLSVEEIDQVSGANPLLIGIGAGVGAGLAVIGDWAGNKFIDWFDSPPAPGGAEISDAIIRDLKPWVDINGMCKPLPGDEADFGS